MRACGVIRTSAMSLRAFGAPLVALVLRWVASVGSIWALFTRHLSIPEDSTMRHLHLVGRTAAALVMTTLVSLAVCTPAHADGTAEPVAAKAAQVDDAMPPPLKRLAVARLVAMRAALAESDRSGAEKISRERAEMLYYIGELSADYGTLGEALDMFDTLSARSPGDAELKTYLGSAYTLRARDFPIQGVLMVLPGPGYYRLYLVDKGVQIMNEAVAANGRHPVVRLIRGATFIGMPRIFNRFDEGLAELELLREWIDNPQTNPHYEALLNDPAFRGDALTRLAAAYYDIGNRQRSRELFQRVATEAPAGSPTAQAGREMAEMLARP